MKILVMFVEPMLYGMDLIREVYEKTDYEYQYIYCHRSITGKDGLTLPENAVVCEGTDTQRKKQIEDVFKRFKPDFAVINGYVGVEQTAAIRYCKKNKIKYAIESDTPLHIPSSKIKALAKKWYLKGLLSDKNCYGFAGGTAQKENLLYYGIDESRTYIMPMSISGDRLLKEYARIESKEDLKKKFGVEGKKTFLFIGRLESVKNVSLLIRAFSKLKKENPETALFIVGDGSEREWLESLVKSECVQDVYFFGYVVFPRIIEFYKAADVFVLPSSHEPWGLVVNESMTLGLPVVVSSKVGCRQDLVKDGYNGFVFENENERDLLEKLSAVCNLDLSVLSKNAIETTDRWNYGYYLECFLGAMKDVAENGRKTI